MDARLAPVPLVAGFAASVQPLVAAVGVYAGGSLASGDYAPAVSDLDLVAVTAGRLDDRQRGDLRRFHTALRAGDPLAARLHCVYVPLGCAGDVGAAHPTWAAGRLFDRPLSGVGRAELLRGGITVLGPPPASLLPPVDDAALRAAVRAELTGYWARTVRDPLPWLEDWCVDLGLLTLARAEVTLETGRLASKTEAMARLGRFGVPADLQDEIARRRRGDGPVLTVGRRVRRGLLARRLVARGVRALTTGPTNP